MKLLEFFGAPPKASVPAVVSAQKALAPVDGRGGWWRLTMPWRVHEPYPGAWQQNMVADADLALAHHAVWACITLIASDIGKLRPKLVEQDSNGIWTEFESSAFSPVLKKPNHYQNYIQFKEAWTISKLIHGNAYALKQRDARGVVIALYLLDPCRVKAFVSDDGAVFYELKADNLSGFERQIMVPAREIIHDRFNCVFHPLVGVSPLYACATAALIGLRIQENQSGFFVNGSNPGGVLTAPGAISNETAQRLSDHWNTEYTGEGAGKIAVLGDGLKFEAMRMSAVDSQLIEQLRWTAEVVCSCYHVPPFKIGVGPMPPYQNAEILNQIYYSDCLQSLIESMELCLDEGLSLTEVPGETYGVELDLDGLLRMDTATQVKTLTEAIGGGLFTPNEARRKIDQKPLKGGDTVYLQQQMFSISALDERDKADPFPAATAAPAVPALPAPSSDNEPMPEDERKALRRVVKSELLRLTHHATNAA
jgi:HK97 family phage portal protein